MKPIADITESQRPAGRDGHRTAPRHSTQRCVPMRIKCFGRQLYVVDSIGQRNALAEVGNPDASPKPPYVVLSAPDANDRHAGSRKARAFQTANLALGRTSVPLTEFLAARGGPRA